MGKPAYETCQLCLNHVPPDIRLRSLDRLDRCMEKCNADLKAIISKPSMTLCTTPFNIVLVFRTFAAEHRMVGSRFRPFACRIVRTAKPSKGEGELNAQRTGSVFADMECLAASLAWREARSGLRAANAIAVAALPGSKELPAAAV